jgi:hypothetical protein
MAAFAICLPRFLIVMAGLVPAIHVFLPFTPSLSVIAGLDPAIHAIPVP